MSVALGIVVEKKPWGGGVGEEGIGVPRGSVAFGASLVLFPGGGGWVGVEVPTVPVRDQIRCDTVGPLTPVDPPSSPPLRPSGTPLAPVVPPQPP